MYFCCGALKRSAKQCKKITKLLKDINILHPDIKFTAIIDSSTGVIISYVCEYEEGMKERIENYLTTVSTSKMSSALLTHNLGFETNKEIVIRGTNSLTLLLELENSELLVMFFEINEISAQVFDTEGFVASIDNILVSLYEALKRTN